MSGLGYAHGPTDAPSLFDIMTGQVIGRIAQRHRAKEFLAFLQQIDRSTPAGLDLHVILDNSSPHKTAAIKQWLEKHPCGFHDHPDTHSTNIRTLIPRSLGHSFHEYSDTDSTAIRTLSGRQ
jgi:hypothetical protein